MKSTQKPTGSDPAKESVRVRRVGQYVTVTPPVPGLMETFVTARHVPDPDTGRVVPAPHPLLWEHDGAGGRGGLQGFAGLEPLVLEWLERNGYAVELTGARPPRWEAPDADRLARLDGPADEGLLAFVRRRDRGLIRYAGGTVDPARLVAQVALGWKDARVLVTATRKADARDFRDRLRAFLPKVSLFVGPGHPQTAGRVVVATHGYAAAGPVGIEDRTVYVSLDPAGMFAANPALRNPVDGLRQARQARMYGLLRAGADLPPHTRALVVALFGPDQVVVPRHGHTVRGVDVAFLTVDGGPPVRWAGDRVGFERAAVWRHPVRNRRLARLAGFVAAGKYKTAKAAFRQLEGVRLKRPGGRVVILAATVEHALALADRLPDAPVVVGKEVWGEGLTPAQTRRLKAGLKDVGEGHPVIATPAGLPAAGPVGVLVRADAGEGLPPLHEDQLVAPGDGGRLLVVDCLDRHSPILRLRTAERKEAYRGMGWAVAGEPEAPPLDRYLAGGPGVRP